MKDKNKYYTLRYDWIGAFKDGVKTPPHRTLRNMGVSWIYGEDFCPVGDCTFFEINEGDFKNIQPLPQWLEVIDDYDFMDGRRYSVKEHKKICGITR